MLSDVPSMCFINRLKGHLRGKTSWLQGEQDGSGTKTTVVHAVRARAGPGAQALRWLLSMCSQNINHLGQRGKPAVTENGHRPVRPGWPLARHFKS